MIELPDEREVVLRFLRVAERRQTAYKHMSSYGWKHVVEDWAKRVYGHHVYVAESTFVGVCLDVGVRGKPVVAGSTSWYFALVPMGFQINPAAPTP